MSTQLSVGQVWTWDAVFDESYSPNRPKNRQPTHVMFAIVTRLVPTQYAFEAIEVVCKKVGDELQVEDVVETIFHSGGFFKDGNMKLVEDPKVISMVKLMAV